MNITDDYTEIPSSSNKQKKELKQLAHSCLWTISICGKKLLETNLSQEDLICIAGIIEQNTKFIDITIFKGNN
jgi:K+/H+ antiporter YhaU regulatory subunit KhtT